MPFSGDRTTSVALADLDGDSDPDLVIGNEDGQQNRLYENRGLGYFTDVTGPRMPAVNDDTFAVVLVDVDGDGARDVLSGNLRQQNRLYINNGTGSFSDATATHMPRDSDATRSLAAGDVDGDGDADLVIGNDGQNRLYLNGGAGVFTDATPSGMPTDSDATHSVALGDVDGDNDLDVVCGNWGQNNSLYLNDGSGSFVDATGMRMPVDQLDTESVVLVDVDDDGDLDIAFANGLDVVMLYANDGAGAFTDVTAARMPGELLPFGKDLAAGELDDDGDVDLVLGAGSGSRIYLNLVRQLASPHLIITGRSARLDVYARGAAPVLAFPFVAPWRARIPVPTIGTWRLDVTTMFALPSVPIPNPGGMASITFTIPNNPNLVGLPVHAQALLVDTATGNLYFTNRTSDRIVR